MVGFMGAIILDFESYSECDIKLHGAWIYSLHPSTELLCACYKAKGAKGRPRLWRPGDPFPALLQTALAEGWEFHAHNAAFEIAMWQNVAAKRLGWPTVPDDRWRCTAAKAAFNGLPRKLETACRVLELGDKGKDTEGHRIMLQVSKPRSRGKFPRYTRENAREKFDRLYAYCGRDVTAEEAIDDYCDDLPPMELALWRLDQKINRRGVRLDVELARGAVKVLTEAQRRAGKVVSDILDDPDVNAEGLPKIKDWLVRQGVPLPTTEKGNPQLDEATLTSLLRQEDLPADVREVLEARATVAFSSVKKYQAALCWAGADDRARDQHKYYQAGPGRWAGTGVQLQNLPRAKSPSPEVLQAITSGDHDAVAKFGPPLQVLSSSLRAMVVARPGCVLSMPDYSSIEARLTHWFAADWATLEKFAQGVDLYVDMACKIFGCRPEDIVEGYDSDGEIIYRPGGKEKRQIGKCAILGLGFGMGWNKFGASIERAVGKTFPQEFLEQVVFAYRDAYPEITQLREHLKRASMTCVTSGKTIYGDRWAYESYRDWMLLHLPSGRRLRYFRPTLTRGRFGREIQYLSPKGRVSLSPSVLVENLVQATARDLMAAAMMRLDQANFYIVFHVHDSIVAEIDKRDVDGPQRMAAIMSEVPEWAKGLPVAVGNQVSERMA